MSTALLREEQHYTYGDYLTWSDDFRCELIDGVVYDMCPAPSRKHQEVVVELVAQVRNQLVGEKSCRVYVAPFDLRLPKGDEADERIDTVVQPDLLVVCDEAKLDERGCRGAPDWVVEVLSPSTSAKDQILKRQLYERHGVREYWLVHPLDGIITRYRLGRDGRFAPPEILAAREPTEVAVLPGLRIEWRELFPEPEVREPPTAYLYR